MQPTNQPPAGPPTPTPYGRGGSPTGYPQPLPGEPTGRLNAARLWSGGVMTAGVAGLTAVVAVLLVRGVLGIPVLAPERDGAMADASTALPAAGAAVAALVATALLHVVILTVPQPVRFFGWIGVLVTAGVVLLPFTTAAGTGTKVGTAAVWLAIGLTVTSLLSAVGRGAVARGVRRRGV
ncbi:DUF6069 family protein [Streptomyces sp. NPDC005017]|uniref:DUF6069 family protein n=1 Tax=Streptomyces sp. NPDC005017 TaxID=3364706 RepID=UPI0036C4F2C4